MTDNLVPGEAYAVAIAAGYDAPMVSDTGYLPDSDWDPEAIARAAVEEAAPYIVANYLDVMGEKLHNGPLGIGLPFSEYGTGVLDGQIRGRNMLLAEAKRLREGANND